MKLLTLLMTCLLMTSPGFSQTGTDTLYINIPVPIAQEIAKDLLRYDNLKLQTSILEDLVSNYKTEKSIRDRVIQRQGDIINNLEKIDVNRQSQISEYSAMNSSLQAALKKEKVKNRIYKSSVGILVVGGVAILVLK